MCMKEANISSYVWHHEWRKAHIPDSCNHEKWDLFSVLHLHEWWVSQTLVNKQKYKHSAWGGQWRVMSLPVPVMKGSHGVNQRCKCVCAQCRYTTLMDVKLQCVYQTHSQKQIPYITAAKPPHSLHLSLSIFGFPWISLNFFVVLVLVSSSFFSLSYVICLCLRSHLLHLNYSGIWNKLN